ncbi:MAG: PorP/SprF family type IX secretion system membrane protein [Taibaiella sp.]|nr:PorP/SprF family type IX secretion system membrane protein [Taibaiella sp.]
MKNFLKIVTAGLLLGFGTKAVAQDIHFSQFYENSILRNPALTGIFSGDFKVGVNYRDQWASVANPFRTVAATAETRILTNRAVGDYLSIGLGAYYDKAGSIGFTSQEIYPAIAFNKAMSDQHNSYLSVGFTFGYLSRFVDMSKMTLSSQVVNGVYSSSNPSGENAPFKSLHNFDMGAGVSLNSSIGLENKANYYLGASLYHINRPTQIFNGGYSTVKLPMKLQFNAGVNFIMSEKFSLALHANYSNQNPYTETIAGGYLTFHSVTPGLPSIFAFSFGGFYRVQDAFIPVVKLDYSNVSLGISYDVTNSSLATSTGGTSATEISLYIRSKYTHKTNPRDGVMCPRFEAEIYSPFEQ